jgi:small subunit ribosomal protein S3
VTVAGKLRSERAHFEKHSSGVLPKSGDVAEKVVKVGVTHVRTKMGLMGIQLRIALKNEIPQDFDYADTSPIDAQTQQPEKLSAQQSSDENVIPSDLREEAVPAGGSANGKG